MAEEAVVEKKSKTEYTEVLMSDGRKVNFAGKRKVNKETLIDEGKIELDEASGILQLQKGAVAVRMDFRNGETRTIDLPLKLLAKFAGHGGEQKFGDELAITVKPGETPPDVEDFVQWIDELNDLIQQGEWGRGRAEGGGGVAGASTVIRAIMEATGKSQDDVKAYIAKRLTADKDLTRRALYDAFRVRGTKTGDIIARMEDEKRKKEAVVSADDELASV